MYTIKRAAERTGITAATLRAWERRYGIVAPRRSDGGYRLYDEEDVRALSLMAQLVGDGWTPSLAADEVARRLRAAQPRDGVTTARPSGLGLEDGTGRPSAPSGRPFGEAIIEAAVALDADALSTTLDEMFALATYETVVDQHLLPAMGALGEAWATRRVSVAGEHLVAHAVMRRLAARYEAASSVGTGPRVLVGLAPGARHELGLFAFAVAARRSGLATDYLGTDLPVEDWVSAVTSREPAAAVLALTTSADAEAVARVVTAVRERRPGLLVAVGGHQQELAPGDVVRLGHQVGAAAADLAERLTVGTSGLATHPTTRRSRRA
jgi:methanogenic corrinoid protein MtbC1